MKFVTWRRRKPTRSRLNTKRAGLLISLPLLAFASFGLHSHAQSLHSENSQAIEDTKRSTSTLDIKSSAARQQNAVQSDVRVRTDSPEPRRRSHEISVDSTRAPRFDGHTEVRINNQPVEVPDNGVIHETIEDESGDTDIRIELRNDGVRQSIENESSTKIKIKTDIESKVEIESSGNSP